MKKIFLIATLAFMATGLEAQPNEGNPNFSPTPLGGVVLLVAAGAAYGGKKAYDAWREKN